MMPYIINAGLILAGCLIFYKILLKRETFYRVNRYILITCLLISFTLPLIPVPQQWSFRKTEEPVKIFKPFTEQQWQPANTVTPQQATPPSVSSPTQAESSSTTSITFQQIMRWLIYLYWFGVIAFGANLLVQIIVLLYRSYTKPVIKDGRFRIVEVSGDKAPCSFGNNIYINPEKYEWNTYSQILLHEKVHIKQNHSLDILLSELVLVFQWFNPFAWNYRKEIESNLEFLTDDHLVQHAAIEKTSYQMSLLQVSVPHFPLSVTTNYNQSLLKKRIAMMNSKKSNVHTIWKYFFLLPLLVLFASLLNEPMAAAQTADAAKEKKEHKGMDTEGSWFATIKGDKISFQFKSDDDEHSFNSSSFSLSDFPNLPKGTAGTFKVTREAGTMEFTGKFEGDQGMGRYKFIADKAYAQQMSGELTDKIDEDDLMVFFFIDIKKSYVQMLKNQGYSKIEKDELIPLAALKVDQEFISSLKSNGFKSLSLEELIPLKSLNITGEYIKEIREAGFPNITADQLVTFKAQNIDGAYVSKMRKEGSPITKNGKEVDPDDIVTFKALKIDDEFINSFKAVGLTDIDHNDLVSMKSVGVTPEFVKTFQDAGYKVNPDNLVALKAQNITPEFVKGFEAVGIKGFDIDDMISLKSLGVTPEFAKSFQAAGYTNIKSDDLIPLKAQNITPAYIKEFEAVGIKNMDLDDVISFKSVGVTPEFVKSFQAVGYTKIKTDDLIPLKAQHITPEFIKGFEAVGFKDLPLDDIISAKAVGVTPEYIKSMKEKGLNYNSLQKYVTLKTID